MTACVLLGHICAWATAGTDVKGQSIEIELSEAGPTNLKILTSDRRYACLRSCCRAQLASRVQQTSHESGAVRAETVRPITIVHSGRSHMARYECICCYDVAGVCDVMVTARLSSVDHQASASPQWTELLTLTIQGVSSIYR